MTTATAPAAVPVSSAQRRVEHRTQIENPVWFPVLSASEKKERPMHCHRWLRFHRRVCCWCHCVLRVCVRVCCRSIHFERANGTRHVIQVTDNFQRQPAKASLVLYLSLSLSRVHSSFFLVLPLPFQYSHRISVSIADRVARCSNDFYASYFVFIFLCPQRDCTLVWLCRVWCAKARMWKKLARTLPKGIAVPKKMATFSKYPFGTSEELMFTSTRTHESGPSALLHTSTQFNGWDVFRESNRWISSGDWCNVANMDLMIFNFLFTALAAVV